MKSEEFNTVLEKCIKDLRETLSAKGEEYTAGLDRLQNFKDAATLNGEEPEQALWGFVTKHIIALKDFVNQVGDNRIPYRQWQEKMGDIRTYMILLEALIIERGIK